MIDRRRFLGRGLGALALGLLERQGLTRLPIFPALCPDPTTGAALLEGTDPLLAIGTATEPRIVDGLPFEPWFTGDSFGNQAIPFHTIDDSTSPAYPPDPSSETEVAIVGGGLSGLATAYLLQRHRPVVLELRDRFGGNALGERWGEQSYSLGSAYVITPDEGSFLESLYAELGMDAAKRDSFPPDPMEIGGSIRDDFWSGAGLPADQQLAFERYAEVVAYMADEGYPEIPLPDDPDDAAYVRELDRCDFRSDLEERMGMPMPPLLAAGVQAYFYSSFGAGMEEISAASGWNFLAAEEYGRWVLPGGNAFIARALWERLRLLDRDTPEGCSPFHLRCSCRVVDVRPRGDRVLVTYQEPSRRFRSLLAKQVVMAGSKHIAKYVIHDLAATDPARFSAMNRIESASYLNVNILLDAPIERDFYDVFLIGDEQFPMEPGASEAQLKVTDMLRGDFTSPATTEGRSVLTLYWPLPFASARFKLIADDVFERFSQAAVPQIRQMLSLLNVPESAVRRIRMTRWGHAVPIARPGFIAGGYAELVGSPLGNIHFVNQDNWALPAVENSLLDARSTAEAIEARL